MPRSINKTPANCAKVNVNVQGTRSADFDWGYLSTRPSNIRIFKGPPESCHIHLWDAMILRDCTPNTDTLSEVESIASRKWDILVMKMCEDYDREYIPKFDHYDSTKSQRRIHLSWRRLLIISFGTFPENAKQFELIS